MNDLISRQDAVNSIESHIRTGDELYPITETDKILNHAFEISASCIYNMPSAEPKQKTGKWITKNDTNHYYTTWWYECSECGQYPPRDGYGQEVLSDYCPHCGCRMVGEEE